MSVFHFETITPDEALSIQTTDFLLFDGGMARQASVAFSPIAEGLETINVTLGGRTVTFGSGLADLALNHAVLFPDGSALVVGTSSDEGLTEIFAPNSALFGGAGNDELFALRGDNLIQGNQGGDTLGAGFGSDTIYGGQGDDALIADIPDDDGIIPPGIDPNAPHHDFAQGNLGNDTIEGGNGSDTLLGGQGNDSVSGGAGADFISGDRGADTVTGGAGADRFHVTADGSVDRITDFHVAEGDQVQLDPGIAFQVAQVVADTVITLAGGGQVVLAGVDMSTLHGDWITGA